MMRLIRHLAFGELEEVVDAWCTTHRVQYYLKTHDAWTLGVHETFQLGDNLREPEVTHDSGLSLVFGRIPRPKAIAWMAEAEGRPWRHLVFDIVDGHTCHHCDAHIEQAACQLWPSDRRLCRDCLPTLKQETLFSH